MEEATRINQTNGCIDHKKNNNCIINIFCNDKKINGMDNDKNNDCHCTINIFCNDSKNDNEKGCY